jgi:hypothetical protein
MKIAASLMMGVGLFTLAIASAQSQNQPTSTAPQSASTPSTRNMPRSAVTAATPAVQGRVSGESQAAPPEFSIGTAEKGASSAPR